MNNLLNLAKGLNQAFPDGNEPFRIITRLDEECGELAKEVNHWERTGVKVQKYGEPSKERLAGEIKNVITAALQVGMYYGVESELLQSIEVSIEKLKKKGYLSVG